MLLLEGTLAVLKTFVIDDLEEGMFVDYVVNQQGKFKITS